jgi:hypothetical protein
MAADKVLAKSGDRFIGRLGMEPARFTYANRTYELYMTYDTLCQARSDVKLLHNKGFYVKIVELQGYKKNGKLGVAAIGIYASPKKR